MRCTRTCPARRGPHVAALLIVLALAGTGCGGDDAARGDVVARAEPSTERGAEEAGRDADAGAAGFAPIAADAGIVVDVAGAVRRPGVYRMPPGARVHEAIQAAGGARRGARLGALNRAAVLVDGQQVLVGAAADGVAAGGTGGNGGAGTGAGAGGTTVNINSADVAALDELPGIGEVTAERIVASRDEAGPFATLDDLDRVPGIGPATIESLRTVATT